MQAEHHPDPVDRASAEADAVNEEALARSCDDALCVNPDHHRLEAAK